LNPEKPATQKADRKEQHLELKTAA
jgi:hypothetical protein